MENTYGKPLINYTKYSNLINLDKISNDDDKKYGMILYLIIL
jgi:hypothetical protein